jgi:putative phosphoribosyl transferase
MTLFADRHQAGQALAERFPPHELPDPLVLALPRGGVPVAVAVAERLGAELDVIVARKIGVPWRPELGVGAVVDGGDPVFDLDLLRQVGLAPEDLAPVVARERAEAHRRVARYRGERPAPVVAGRSVVVVDDGLATGVTARAALAAVRARGPAHLVFAAPVCAAQPAAALESEVDRVLCAHCLETFIAVGRWYDDFSQVSDDEVVALLAAARADR